MLLVILLALAVVVGLGWLLYRRPTGNIDHDQLPDATKRFSSRDEVEAKSPWAVFRNPRGPYL